MAAAGVVLASVVIAACSGPASGNLAARHSHQHGNPSEHTIVVWDDAADRALAAISVPGEMDSLAGRLANPLSRVATPMTTDGGADANAGRYVLAFECIGGGQIEAAIWINNARAHVRSACQEQPMQVRRLYLTAPKAGTMYIQFEATQRETVAIAARVGRISRGSP